MVIRCSQKNNLRFAIIPARGGSKGVPHKNIRLLAGRPLIHYAIEACLETPEIDCVAVSTDSEEIKKSVAVFGDVVIIDRPAALADDHATSEAALLHAVGYFEGKGVEIETILFVQATSPLSEPDDFSRLLAKIDAGFDSAAFYTEDYGYFFDEQDVLSAHLPRQIRAPRKREAGNAWAFRKEGFKKHKARLFGKIGLCPIEEPKHLEIDTEKDLIMTERLLLLRERDKKHLYYWSRPRPIEPDGDTFEERYWGEIIDPDGKLRDRTQEKEQRIQDLKEEISFINQLAPGRILDVGCGMGELLSAVDGGWEKYGLEISKHAAKKASEYAEVFCGALGEAPYDKEFFDVIVMHHVIEHLPAPEDDIGRVRDMLRPGGRLVIATPDFDSAMARRYGQQFRLLNDITHVSLFSRISLRWFLEDYGFAIDCESFPYFDTRHFTRDNLLRLFDTTQVSPPFWGSVMTFYCTKK